MNNRPAPPKMTKRQAKILWNGLTAKQKQEFNEMYAKLQRGELMLKNVCVDDNEQIQRIILDPKEPLSKPITPFMKHFSAKD